MDSVQALVDGFILRDVVTGLDVAIDAWNLYNVQVYLVLLCVCACVYVCVRVCTPLCVCIFYQACQVLTSNVDAG